MRKIKRSIEKRKKGKENELSQNFIDLIQKLIKLQKTKSQLRIFSEEESEIYLVQ